MVYMADLSWTNARGQRLYATCFQPKEVDCIKSAMVFIHGYAEHSGRKTAAFKQLADAGIAVYVYDVHGFGRSEPTEPTQRALLWDYNYLIDDCCEFADLARSYHMKLGLPSVPWFLAGFSLGGLTACHAALRQQQAWAGLVLVSACMWVRMTIVTQIQRLIAPILDYLCPTARIVQRLDPARDLNPDPEEVADYISDPLVYRGNTAVRTAVQMGEAVFTMKDMRHELELPIYALHSTDDNITPYKDLVEFFNATSTPQHQKHLQTVEGGYHDLIGGKDREQYVKGIVSWVHSIAATAYERESAA